MRANHKVFWTHIAVRDLLRIVGYIAARDSAGAEEVYRSIRNQTEGLGQLPRGGHVVPELQFQGVLLYSEIVQTPWRIIYRVLEDKIVILAVIDSRRNVADILLERILGTGKKHVFNAPKYARNAAGNDGCFRLGGRKDNDMV